MAEFTTREIEYMDYLDDLYPCGEHSFGLMFFKADIIAFNCGLDEYFQAKEEISVVDEVTGSTFTFKDHIDKERFFDLWDEVVIRAEGVEK